MKFRSPHSRTRWQDDRIDDLDRKVDSLAHEMHEGFRAVHARFDSMHRTMIVMLGTIMSTMVAGFGAVLATQL